MQEANRDRLGVDLGQRVEREWLELAVRAHPPGHAETALERNERLRVRGTQSVEMCACLPAQVQQVLEAGVGDERCARALPLQQGIRRDGGSVREPLHVARADRPCDGDDGFLLPRRGQHLGGGHAPLVEQHRVREGSANVDAEDGHSGRLTP